MKPLENGGVMTAYGMLARVCTVSLGLGSLCLPARADWQYTKWGMTPEQVAGASKGLVTAEKGASGSQIGGYDFWTQGAYNSGNYQFKATFYFQQTHLTMLRLSLPWDMSQCYALRADLEGTYGKPTSVDKDRLSDNANWLDQKTNNRVDLMILTDLSCEVQYKPLTSPSAKGL